MFTQKKKQLFEAPVKTASKKEATSANSFISAGLAEKRNRTVTANGALAYKRLEGTNAELTTQFGSIGTQKVPRDYAKIAVDMEKLWDENPLNCIRFAFFTRMISRTVQYLDGTKTQVSQKGMELKHEGIMRLVWLQLNHPEAFWPYVELVPIVGSWKDIFQMLSFDLIHHGWKGRELDWEKFGVLILTHLSNENALNLIKKFLPAIKSRAQCKTVEAQADNLIGKWLCSLIFNPKEGESEGTTYKHYRKLKTSGTAHEWQKLISKKQLTSLDFGKIPGRALSKLVNSKFLTNQSLSDKYTAWLEKQITEGKTIKYTGFVHELFENLDFRDMTQRKTVDLQFKELVEKTKGNEEFNTNLIVVRDTSSSMSNLASGSKMTCYNVAKALALFFSEFTTGHFTDSWIEFNSKAKMHLWKGNTPTEKWVNDSSNFIGSTDFESVLKLFVSIKAGGVPEEEFPKGILCVSDAEFNPSSLSDTNISAAKEILRRGGFSEEYCKNFVIILWNLQESHYIKFHTSVTTAPNTFYFSGFSPSTIAFVLGGKVKNAEELALEALNQEVLQLIEI